MMQWYSVTLMPVESSFFRSATAGRTPGNSAGAAACQSSTRWPLLLDGLLPKLLGAHVSARRQRFKAHQLIAVEDSQFPATIHHPQFAAPRTLAPENGLAAVRMHTGRCITP